MIQSHDTTKNSSNNKKKYIETILRSITISFSHNLYTKEGLLWFLLKIICNFIIFEGRVKCNKSLMGNYDK